MADVARAVDNQMAISFALTSRVLSYSNKSNNNVFFPLHFSFSSAQTFHQLHENPRHI